MNNYELKIKNYLITVLLMSVGFSQPLNIQGMARDHDGNMLPDGTYNFVFRLYTASTGGTAAWTENQSLSVTNGVFSANMGAVTDMNSLNFNNDHWLSLEIGSNGELSPRTKLVVTPYALLAAQSGVTNVYPSSGSVGVGTTSPDTKLSVIGKVRAANASNENEFTQIGHGGSHGYIRTEGDGRLLIQHDHNTKLSIESGGDVGINIENPEEKLHINNGNIYLGQGGNNADYGKITWDLNNGAPTDYHWIGYDSDIDPWWMILQTHSSEGVRIRTSQDGDILIAGGSNNDQTGVGRGVKLIGDLRVDDRIYQQVGSDEVKQWKLHDFDNFDSGNEGWTGAASDGRYNCGGSIYGGRDEAAASEVLRKSWTPPSGTQFIKIEMEVYALDSWDNEIFFVYKEGNWKNNMEAFRSPRIHHSNGQNLCSRSDYADRYINVVIFGEWDGSGNVTIAVDAHLNGNSHDESFGVDNVAFYVR